MPSSTVRSMMALLARGVEALDRSAKAQEDLITLAREERDGESFVGPPSCPHCGMVNPKISSGGEEGQGEMGTYVLVARCQSCHKMFYAVSQGWMCFTDAHETRAQIEGRNT